MMFNKLVISTSARRKQRTARFFFGTFVFYSLAVAVAFALSIIVSNPQLADTGSSSVLMIAAAPAPTGGPPPKPVAHRDTQTAPRNDPTHVRDLADVLATNHSTAPRPNAPPGPPSVGPIVDPSATGDGPYIPGAPPGIGSSPIGGHGDATAPPPRPLDPVRPTPQPRADDNKPMRLTSTVLQGKAIVRRTPDYPQLAKQIRLAGSVSVEVMISPDGRVETARVVSGHTLLATEAVKAAYGWRFGPTLLNGTPVRVTGVIVFNFTLE